MGFYFPQKKDPPFLRGTHYLQLIVDDALDPQEGVQQDKQKTQARHEIESYTKNHSCLSEDCSNKISSTFQ